MWYVYVDSVTISQLLPGCTGAPTGGTTIASAPAVCPNIPFSLSVNSASSGASGFTYQWQSSPDSINWTNIAGETNSTYASTTGITAVTYYRRTITCGGSSANSTPVKVNINAISLCACNPTNGTTLHSSTSPSLETVSIVGTTLNVSQTGVPTSGWSIYNTVIPDVSQGVSFTLNTQYSAAPTQAAVWVDWNQDGIFDATTEYYAIAISGTSSSTNIAVPANAVLGNTLMRIRIRAANFAAADACGLFGSGETEDYVINITAGTACSGAPVGGTAISANSSVCAGTNLNFTVTGATSGVTSLTYKWQVSTDSGANFINVANSDSLSHFVGGFSTPACYRRMIKCGTDSAYSSMVCVAINQASLCVCSPANGTTLHGGTTPSIDTVSIQGTTLNVAHPGEPTDGYTSYNSPIPDVAQGVTYTLYTGFSGAGIASVWFDWNQNGTFETSEWTQITTNAANGTISFIVDPNAILGNTLMRIRTRSSGSPNAAPDACTEFFSGETEDYVINIIPGTPCTGTPAPGTAVSSQNTVCPGASFNLSVTGIVPTTTGLTYQWQISTDGGNSHTDIVGGDSLNHHEAGITVNTCYRRAITCGGNTAYSNWVCVTVNPAIFCPCSPNTGITLHSGTGPTIDSVSITGTKLNNKSTGAPTNGYTLFNDTTIIPSLAQGANYILYTKYSATPTWGAAWIDLNQDGAFDPSTEYFQFSVNGTTGSTTLAIPATATTGLTIMRIRIANTTYSGSASCSNFFSGETEDYVVDIIAGTPCSGAPIPGTAVSSVNSICPNTPFNLSISGTTSNTLGLTYQWQMSIDGGTTPVDIAGADSLTHYEAAGITVNTCYRRAITCGANTTYTNWVCVTVNPVILCPCSPITGSALHSATGPSIDSVSIQSTTLNNNSLGTPINGYTLYTDTAKIPTLTQGVSYTLYTKFSATPSWGAAWIDFNQDGTFDQNTEYFQFTINANSSSTTITIPSAPNSVTGLTLMRIRIASSTYAGSDACTLFFSGETEDYAVNISGGVVCSGPPTPGTTILASPTILCANTAFTLDVSGATANQGNLTYQWQSSSDNSNWNDITGETNPSYTNSLGITDSMYYRRTITCNATYIDLSTPILVKLSGALSTYPFVESFESLTSYGAGVLPNCWTTVATGTKITSAGTPVRNSKTARTGSNYVWAKYSSSAYLISPSLLLTGGQAYTFSYYYRPTDPTNGFVIKTFIGTAADTATLKTNQVGTTIYNPKDSSKWTLATFNYTPTTSGNYYFAINSTAPVAPWYLMFDDINIALSSLPVKMIQFKGEKINTKNVLSWITTNEKDNKGFEVQRSFNGTEFNKIGFVSSASEKGNSNGNLNYRFTDNQSPAGINYYRLKQIDINGKENISEIVLIKGEKTNKIEFASIYPNPAKDKLSLIVSSPATQNLNIVLTDVSGRIIKEEKLFANEGNNQLAINVSSLPSGTYIIKANCNNGCEAAIQKFIKQ